MFESDINTYYLVIYYETRKDDYDIKNYTEVDLTQFISILNVIIMMKNIYDIYQIGYSSDN